MSGIVEKIKATKSPEFPWQKLKRLEEENKNVNAQVNLLQNDLQLAKLDVASLQSNNTKLKQDADALYNENLGLKQQRDEAYASMNDLKRRNAELEQVLERFTMILKTNSGIDKDEITNLHNVAVASQNQENIYRSSTNLPNIAGILFKSRFEVQHTMTTTIQGLQGRAETAYKKKYT